MPDKKSIPRETSSAVSSLSSPYRRGQPLVPRILYARVRIPIFVVLLVKLAVNADEGVLDGERAAVLACPNSDVPVVARMCCLEVEDARLASEYGCVRMQEVSSADAGEAHLPYGPVQCKAL